MDGLSIRSDVCARKVWGVKRDVWIYLARRIYCAFYPSRDNSTERVVGDMVRDALDPENVFLRMLPATYYSSSNPLAD